GGADVGWQVLVSTNLTNWSFLSKIALSNGPTTFVDSNAASFDQRYYQVYQDLMFSDCLGFARVDVASNYTLISNPLLAPTNTLNALLNQLPDYSGISKWNEAITNWDTYFSYAGVWYGPNPNATLYPGEGVLLQSSAATNVMFIGKVMQCNLSNPI